ncbi:hypothetical protein TNCV_2152051 [Trichonephila clavipes]|nr:hypothetical protein TNCV_2152051 [Trichonephila clavipes]
MVPSSWSALSHDRPYMNPIFNQLSVFALALAQSTTVYEPRNFEPWSSDVDDTGAGTPPSTHHTTPTGGRFAALYSSVHRCPSTAGL